MLTQPNLRDECRIRANVIAKRLMRGQPAVTPRCRRRRHRRRGRDNRENMLRPADVLANEAPHFFTEWK